MPIDKEEPLTLEESIIEYKINKNYKIYVDKNSNMYKTYVSQTLKDKTVRFVGLMYRKERNRIAK